MLPISLIDFKVKICYNQLIPLRGRGRSVMKGTLVAFRGTREGLVVSVNCESSFQEIKDNLEERLKATGEFFRGAVATIDLGGKELSGEELEELKRILIEDYGMALTGLVSSSQKTVNIAEDVGLSIININSMAIREAPTEKTEEHETPWQEVISPVDTLLIKHIIRAGQCVDFDGNVVILGDINPGAEIIARGDIIVLGALRGMAHAGATGNQEAIIAAWHLQPIQLRIADYIARPPDSEMMELRSFEVARIREGMIVIEAYEPGKF